MAQRVGQGSRWAVLVRSCAPACLYAYMPAGKMPAGKMPAGKMPAGKMPACLLLDRRRLDAAML